MSLRVAISLGFKELFACQVDGVLVLGRQHEGEPDPFHLTDERLVIAPMEEVSISREHVKIEPRGSRRISITNLSNRVAIDVNGFGQLAPQAQTEARIPVLVRLGSRTIHIESTAPLPVNTLSHRTLAPGKSSLSPDSLHPAQLTQLASSYTQLEPLVRILQQVVDLLQHATSKHELCEQACAAAVNLLGLNRAQLVLRDHNDWTLEAESPGNLTGQRLPVQTLLDHALHEKRVSFELDEPAEQANPFGPRAFVVAAPLLDDSGDVVGALCASQRQLAGVTSVSHVAQLQAHLLELIACAVASALLRIKHEKASQALRLQFEQFFTEKLSRQLELHPDLLEGRDAEVTVLFCDIRNFTSHSDRLQAAQIFQWVNGVMDALSDCVMKYDGVLVDYIGDELMAMWGAPEDQPTHAMRACRAALDMVRRMPGLNDRWKSLLKAPFEVGIGINTGLVRVGNTGSPQKFKYGPLGSTVNIASRVEGATKYFRRPILISESTRQRLDDSFRTRRLCDVRLVNVELPTRLYELYDIGEVDERLRAQYEQALEAFEETDLQTASALLGSALHQFPHDGPCRVLLKRTLDCLIDDTQLFDPAWELPGK